MNQTYGSQVVVNRHKFLSMKAQLSVLSPKSLSPALLTGCIAMEGREKVFIADVLVGRQRTEKAR